MSGRRLGTHLVVVCLGFNLSLSAATRTWTGATSGAWTTGSNWVGGVAPAAGDLLIFPDTGVTNFNTSNDFPSGTNVPQIDIQKSGYVFTGNSISTSNIVYTAADSAPTSFFIQTTATSPTLTITVNGTSSVLNMEASINNNGFPLNLTVAGSLNVSGAISGTGTIIKTGLGSLTLEGANTYSGMTDVETGTLQAGSLGLGAGNGTQPTGTRVAAEGSLALLAGATIANEFVSFEGAPSSGALSFGCASSAFSCSWNGPMSLVGTPRFASGTVNGVISGAGGIMKAFSDATLSLFAKNVYTGVTQIQAGTMGIYGSQPNSQVQVQSGATLRGSNQVGSIVSTGGTVSAQTPPPAGPAVTLTANGGLTLDPASTLELSGNPDGSENDKLSVIGAVNLDGNLSFVAGSGVTLGTTYTIVENDGTDAIAGVFRNLPEGTTFGAGSEAFRITYTGGTGNDIVLTNVDSVTISNIDPSAGLSVGGTSTTITGTGFQSGASVTFGGVAATSVTVNSPTSITAVTAARTTSVASNGLVDLVVTSGGVSATLTNGYRYLPFDPNGDNAITVADVVYLLNFLFASGTAPLRSGEANGDGAVNLLDVFYVIHYLFNGGPLPQNTTL